MNFLSYNVLEHSPSTTLASLFLSVLMQFQTFIEVPKILRSNTFSSMLEQMAAFLTIVHQQAQVSASTVKYTSLHNQIAGIKIRKHVYIHHYSVIYSSSRSVFLLKKNVLLLDLWFLFSFSKGIPFGWLCISFFAYRLLFHLKNYSQSEYEHVLFISDYWQLEVHLCSSHVNFSASASWCFITIFIYNYFINVTPLLDPE